MSTRANIKFRDEDGKEIQVYRHSDGYPSIIEPDIDKAISIGSGRWSGSEIGLSYRYSLLCTIPIGKKRDSPIMN